MKMIIKKMTLDNFKGAKHLELDLDGERIMLKGRNGSFKTTCSDAFYYVFCGCNTEMVKNPFITPLGEDEVVSRVEMEIEIDGRPCQVAKSQKFKRKTDDEGKTTSSTTNTYEVNSVQKTERDFVSDLKERGLDMENFLIYSNPDAFFADTSKKGRDELRKILFKMAETTTDEEIADSVHADDVKALLEKGYKLDEVESMNKATIKKIIDTCGKSNELIDAKIEGLFSSIEEVDEKALAVKEKELESRIAEIDSAINSSSDKTSAIKRRLSEIELDIREIGVKADHEYQIALADKQNEISALETKIIFEQSQYDIAANDVNRTKEQITDIESELSSLRDRYKAIQEEVIDAESTKCPTCHRVYAKSKVDQIEKDFEKSKVNRLSRCKDDGERAKERLAEVQKANTKAKEDHSRLHTEIGKLKNELEKLKTEKSAMPAKADISGDEDYLNLCAEKESLEKELSNEWSNDNSKLIDERAEVKAELDRVKADLGLVEHNLKVDAKITELREEKRHAEINKAKAEKIINQALDIRKAKNERLVESINKHFNIVSFKLWDLKKNGTYDDVVDLLIDGKPASTCANGSLLQLAKVDCLSGLQNFFDQHIPVWLDDAALITGNTRERIKLDSQLIMLIATDGIGELKIEREG